MTNRIKIIIAISVLSIVTVAFLISTQSYFNNKEIRLASDKCYEIGGLPKVERDSLTLSYSFSCQKDN
ncbi:hypothetical protein SAMN05192534_10321 [Alteribacillus persepolensis]|uniref:Uncharacterized protein n=1 Tax=Alteribacillus persepolensis TaxID=568899 RepID=A0A1G8AUP3_9BACI|nr:hypothetical protein SAMN05192534_10321 [Alteribacillus persepolensis]